MPSARFAFNCCSRGCFFTWELKSAILDKPPAAAHRTAVLEKRAAPPTERTAAQDAPRTNSVLRSTMQVPSVRAARTNPNQIPSQAPQTALKWPSPQPRGPGLAYSECAGSAFARCEGKRSAAQSNGHLDFAFVIRRPSPSIVSCVLGGVEGRSPRRKIDLRVHVRAPFRCH